MEAQGYTFIPDKEHGTLDDLLYSMYNPEKTSGPSGPPIQHTYVSDQSPIFQVIAFKRIQESGDIDLLQLIVSTQSSTPFSCILQFHSSTLSLTWNLTKLTPSLWDLPACVMNYITHDAAVSLYPRATFCDRVSLVFGRPKNFSRIAHKYGLRGFRFQTVLHPSAFLTGGAFQSGERCTRDSMCWVVPLGILSSTTEHGDMPNRQGNRTDRVDLHSWELNSIPKDDEDMRIITNGFPPLASIRYLDMNLPIFEQNYAISPQFDLDITRFVLEQMRIEAAKSRYSTRSGLNQEQSTFK